jgi:hypothetical protein
MFADNVFADIGSKFYIFYMSWRWVTSAQKIEAEKDAILCKYLRERGQETPIFTFRLEESRLLQKS